jgi:hypothetical protein
MLKPAWSKGHGRLATVARQQLAPDHLSHTLVIIALFCQARNLAGVLKAGCYRRLKNWPTSAVFRRVQQCTGIVPANRR